MYMCVCVCVCVQQIQYYDYIIYYFGGFNKYIIVDLVKCGVLTLRAIEMTAIIIINVTPEVSAQLPEWLGILYVCIYVPVCPSVLPMV